MWKRDDAAKPGPPPARPAGAEPSGSGRSPGAPAATSDRPRTDGREAVNVGKSVVITGELTGSEDVFIEGHVEGSIELRQNVLTVGPNGKLKAQVLARQVVVLGEVVGNITATEKVAIRDDGAVDGDLIAPRVAIAEGAHFRGSIDMQRRSGGTPAGAAPQRTDTAGSSDGGSAGAKS